MERQSSDDRRNSVLPHTIVDTAAGDDEKISHRVRGDEGKCLDSAYG
jgi:hypothetical protein